MRPKNALRAAPLFFLCLYAFFAISICGWAQTAELYRIDSLERKLSAAKQDTSRINLLLALSESIACTDTIAKARYANEAVLLAEHIHWPKGQMKASRALGNIFSECCSDFTKAMVCFESYRSVAESCGDGKCASDALSSIARIHCLTGRYGKALEYYKKSLEADNDPVQQVIRLGKMGTVYHDIGYYEKAQECYSRALNTLELYLERNKRKAVANDTLMLDNLITKVGNIYAATAEYEKALIMYQHALDINKQIGNKQSEIFALKNIGRVYEIKQDYGAAKRYYYASLEEATRYNLQLVEAEIWNKLANMYIETDSLQASVSCSEKALKILSGWDMKKGRLDASLQLAATYIILGKISRRQKENNAAIGYFQKALDICSQTGSLNLKSEVWKELWTTYNQVNEYKKALNAHIQYTAARDSVYNIEQAKEITRNLMQEDFNARQHSDSLYQANEKKLLRLDLQKQQILSYSGLAGLLLVITLAFVIFKSYKHEKRTKTIIEFEKQKSDDLLLNILPKDVADELKISGRAHAKEFDNVTVMFVDFVNFTVIAEKMAPQELVDELDTCFREFDAIVTGYNIEKIKTVGDAYLAVAGLPRTDRDHASQAIKAAKEIKAYMDKRRASAGSKIFELRIGIHSGSVVAGIVGAKKFAYDIWGDTVNTAARLEQNCEPGKINISQTTYDLVKDQFACVYRGEIGAKNKGLLKMYFVS